MHALIVNAGNTFTQLALLDNGLLGDLTTCPTADLLDGVEPAIVSSNNDLPIVAAAVVPRLRDVWANRNVLWLSAKLKLNVDFSDVNTETLGADRVANAVAAAVLTELPTIIVDCGTAITFELVDENARFLGGAILPGRQLARNALNDGAAQLPNAPLSESIPATLGTDTPGSIRSGIDRGIIGAVQYLLDGYLQDLGSHASAIAVGGDRDYFCRYVVGLKPGPPKFTLNGVATAAGLLCDEP